MAERFAAGHRPGLDGGKPVHIAATVDEVLPPRHEACAGNAMRRRAGIPMNGSSSSASFHTHAARKRLLLPRLRDKHGIGMIW